MLLRHAAAVGGGKPFCVGSWFKTPKVAWLALLEPLCKLLGPFIGVCDELLPYKPFFVDGLIDHQRIHALQHTLMYLSIAARAFQRPSRVAEEDCAVRRLKVRQNLRIRVHRVVGPQPY